jgi:hypothetical protein
MVYSKKIVYALFLVLVVMVVVVVAVGLNKLASIELDRVSSEVNIAIGKATVKLRGLRWLSSAEQLGDKLSLGVVLGLRGERVGGRGHGGRQDSKGNSSKFHDK